MAITLPALNFAKLDGIAFIGYKISENMNRKQRKNIIIALAILGGVVAALTILAQLTG